MCKLTSVTQKAAGPEETGDGQHYATAETVGGDQQAAL